MYDTFGVRSCPTTVVAALPRRASNLLLTSALLFEIVSILPTGCEHAECVLPRVPSLVWNASKSVMSWRRLLVAI